jgi:hypothetical protein
MTEATLPLGPVEGPVQEPIESREQIFARVLEAKLGQGYHLESRNTTDAVIFTKGRRKWFGLVAGGPGRRRRISLDPDGGLTTTGL